jgi:hypothetical protein
MGAFCPRLTGMEAVMSRKIVLGVLAATLATFAGTLSASADERGAYAPQYGNYMWRGPAFVRFEQPQARYGYRWRRYEMARRIERETRRHCR